MNYGVSKRQVLPSITRRSVLGALGGYPLFTQLHYPTVFLFCGNVAAKMVPHLRIPLIPLRVWGGRIYGPRQYGGYLKLVHRGCVPDKGVYHGEFMYIRMLLGPRPQHQLINQPGSPLQSCILSAKQSSHRPGFSLDSFSLPPQ